MALLLRSMARNTSNRMNTLTVLVVLGVLLCRNLTVPAVRAESIARTKAPRVVTVRPAVPVRIGVPLRIKIPSIRVNAVIRSVGLAPDGSMGVPKLPMDTAWYMLGPKPGETGSATIAGHVNWWHGATGVFANLRKLKPGDTITVQDDKGALVSFIVRKIRSYGTAEDSSDVFSSTDGKAHLNLITCDGAWDKRAQQYSKRLVVFTDKK